MQRSALWPALFLILSGLFIMREMDHPVVRGIDARFYDWLSTQGKGPARRPALTLVEINDASMARESGWPWRPLDYSLFLKAVLPARPGVVGIEPILDWDDEPSNLAILKNYLLRTPKVLLAANLEVVRDPDAAMISLPILRKVTGNLAGLPEFAGIRNAPAEDVADRGVLGAVHFNTRHDGHLRRVPMVMRYRGDAVPSFVLQSLMLWLQLVPDDIELRIGESVRLGNIVEVPIDSEGNLWVNFSCLHLVQRVAFEDLLLAVEETEAGVAPGFDLSQLGRHIVLLGRTDAVSRSFNIAGGRRVSRVEALAAAIATIQQRGFQREIAGWGLMLIVLAAGAMCFVAWRMSRSFVFWLILILCAVYGMVAVGVYNSHYLLMPAVLPFGLLLLVFIMRLFLPEPKR